MRRPIVLVLLAALLASGTVQAQSGPSGGEIRIGVLSDMSGVLADTGGPGSTLAAQMAAEDFAAAEKPSFEVRVISSDHQNKADIAASTARRWFDQDRIDLIVDIPNSAAALAVLNIAREKNRMVIVTGAVTSRITEEDCAPTVLHWVYDSYATAGTTARAVTRQGNKSWFFITSDYVGGYALEEDAMNGVTGQGGTVLGRIRHPFPESDFSSFLLTAQASGAKVIGTANAGVDTTNLIKQAAEFGLNKVMDLAATVLFITDVHSLGLASAQGMFLTTAFYWDYDDKTRAWARRFYARAGKMPTMVHAGVYSGVLHYLKSVQRGGSRDVARVLKEMRSAPVEDMFSRNGHLREDGLMVHDMFLAQVKAPSESKAAWDYYKILEVIPGDRAFRPLSESKCKLVGKPD